MKYTIKKGDTLSAIAKRFDTTVSEIQRANSSLIKNVDKISVGWVIQIPETKDELNLTELLEKCIADIDELESFRKLMKCLEV